MKSSKIYFPSLSLELFIVVLTIQSHMAYDGSDFSIPIEIGLKEELDIEQLSLLEAIEDDRDKLTQIPANQELNLDKNTLGITPKSCTGKCYNVAMDFPNQNQFFGPWLNWQASHGTPTVNTNSIWMWSANQIGEGINLAANFKKGNEYCIESLMNLSWVSNSPAPGGSFANVDLTNGPIIGTFNSFGTAIPSLTSPNQQLLQQPYYGLTNPYNQNYIMSFIASDNFSNIWFHPSSPFSQVNMQISRLRICEENDPCDFAIRVKQKVFCGFVKFYSLVYSVTGLNVLGYSWDFGDGNTSTDAFPSHFYTEPGYYIASLKVTMTNSNGKCCTKTYSFRIAIEECNRCKTLQYANISITNYGSTVKFEPTVPSSYGNMYYSWNFSDGTYYSTREVWKNSVPAYAILNIFYSADYANIPCCSVEIKRHFYYNPLGNLVSAYPFRQISVAGSDDKCVEDSASKLRDVASDDGFSIDDLEDVILKEHQVIKFNK